MRQQTQVKTTLGRPLGGVVALLVTVPLVLGGCKDSPPVDAPAGGDPCNSPSSETQRIMDGLRSSCESCHISGTRGFFASSSAFQQLLVADPRLVSPGDPDNSELVRLLEGNGTGGFKQMPTGSQSYSQLVAAGTVSLTVDEVRTWIRGLSAQTRGTSPSTTARRNVRVGAAQVQRTLYQQLGLDYSDFFTTGDDYGIPVATAIDYDSVYAVQAPEMYPAPFASRLSPQDRWGALGGGSAFLQARSDTSMAPSFTQALAQISQRWCRLALAKNGKNNPVLFPQGGSLSTDATTAKQTLKRWQLHFLSEPASDADIETLYSKLFAPLQQQAAAIEPAYVGACSYFIRHPHWIFY